MSHLEDRLLQPKRLETILARLLDRRHERTERRREHLAELNRRATETDQRLNQLCDAIELGVAALDDLGLKDRIANLKTIRDQAAADAELIGTTLDGPGDRAVTPEMIDTLSQAARTSLRIEGGGYRRDQLRPSPGASRSLTTRFGSWGRNRTCFKASLLLQAGK